MKRAILLLCLLPLPALCEIPPGYADRLADAIKLAENSHTHPYGIMLPGCRYNEAKSRAACLRTIRHRYALWEASGAQGEFINYLSMSYAPIGASNDPNNLNLNWKRNVTAIINKQKD